MNNPFRLLVVLGLWLAAPLPHTAVIKAAQPSADNASSSAGMLNLVGGDFVTGVLASESGGSAIAWQHPHLDRPLVFNRDHVASITFAGVGEAPLEQGKFVFELVGSDRIYGSLEKPEPAVTEAPAEREDLAEEAAEDDSSETLSAQNAAPDSSNADDDVTNAAAAETVSPEKPEPSAKQEDQSDFVTIISGDRRWQVRRSDITAVHRWDDGKRVLFRGPGRLSDWRVTPDDAENSWRDLGGILSGDGGEIARDITLAKSFELEIDLTWSESPRFAFSIGNKQPGEPVQRMVKVNNLLRFEEVATQSYRQGFKIEVWGDQVVAVWETDALADVIPIAKTSDRSATLLIRFDIENSSIKIFGEGRTELGQLSVRDGVLGVSEKQDAPSTLAMVVTTGSIQINRMDVFDRDQTTKNSNELVLDIQEMARARPQAIQPMNPEHWRLVTHSGLRLTGRVESIGETTLAFNATRLGETVEFANSDIRGLSPTSLRINEKLSSKTSKIIGIGRLEIAGTMLHGSLVDNEPSQQQDSGEDASDAGDVAKNLGLKTSGTALLFQPLNSNRVGLTASVDGRILYRDPPPPKPKVWANRSVAKMQRRVGFFEFIFNALGNNQQPASLPEAVGDNHRLHLKTGEWIVATVKRIDTDTIFFESNLSEQTELPRDQVSRIDFWTKGDGKDLDEKTEAQLLTVPRIQKQNRPTHLIFSRTGDVLRCRLLSVDEDTIEIQTRLESLRINRSLVSRIVWLADDQSDKPPGNQSGDEAAIKADELASNQAATDKSEEDRGVEILIRKSDGTRIHMRPEHVRDGVLNGKSELLGLCDVRVASIDEIKFGDTASFSSVAPRWKLSDAPEPTIPDAGGGGGGSSGSASVLVGKTAPDLKLKTLADQSFSVADYRGKVLVLDFWATWCGPCIAAMPVIDQVVSQFDDGEVKLVAVNLQEPAETIRQTLDRLELEPTVAMDIDGVAAQRYQANAIPQTVVIDRAGKITHVFVGGGGKLAENLTAAIESALNNQPNDDGEQL